MKTNQPRKTFLEFSNYRSGITLFFVIGFILCLLIPNSIVAQPTKIIHGKVSSKSGDLLPGVSILVKGTTIGTVTNNDGEYNLSVDKVDATIVFSFIGFTSVEIKPGNKSSIDIVLEENAIQVDDVVVVGYGTMKKKDLTGSVSSVKTDRLENEKPQAIQDILRGNIAGLEVGISTSAKGGGNIEIRGDNSLKTSSSPLIVVDGVIYMGSMEDINPYDIESIDVLKDASSSAVFGARSANGVILVTTKKGKIGKPIINVSSSVGLATKGRMENVWGPNEFITWRQDVLRSMNYYNPATNTKLYLFDNPGNLPANVSMDQWMDGKTGSATDIWLSRLGLTAIEINNYKANKSVNWEDKVYQIGLRQDHNLSISGKTDKASYYWSLGYNNNEGIIVGDQFNTIRSRLNLDVKVTDWLTVGLNTQFSNRDESGIPAIWDGTSGVVGNSPWGSFYKDDGKTIRLSAVDDPVGSQNPLYSRTFQERRRVFNEINSNLYTTVKLPFGITYQLTFAPRYQWYANMNHNSAKHEEWAAFGGSASREQSQIYSWQVDNILKWSKSINKIHQIDITLLANAEKYQSWQNSMYIEGFSPTDALGFHNMSAGKSSTTSISSDDQYSTGDALMARGFYSLKNRYMVTLSVRRDGYSAFGLKNPRGIFPAAALGWVFSDESFFKNKNLYGKMRLSWGQNGNREIGRYDALSDMSTGKYPYQTLGGTLYESNQLYVNHMSNPNLKWEKTQSLNLGLDYSFKKGLIEGSIEVYQSSTLDLLVDRKLPDVVGFSSVTSNLGQIENKGIEVVLNSRIINKENFKWRSGINFSLNRNKIIHLYGDMIDVKDANGSVTGKREADDITNGWFIGHALDQIWQPVILGVWQIGEETEAARYSQYPGDFKIKDVDNNGKINQLDNEFQGYKQPRFRINLRQDFNIYKNFDFSFSFYSYWGHYGNYDVAKGNGPAGKPERNSSYTTPYWTPANPLNDYARIRSYAGGSSFTVWRENSFIRLDNVSFAYTLPVSLLEKVGISSLKITCSTHNLGVFAPRWDYWDPEYSGPNPRYFTLGVNLTL
jgi:TonB-linked SusC/RagA family outer membrane protein